MLHVHNKYWYKIEEAVKSDKKKRSDPELHLNATMDLDTADSWRWETTSVRKWAVRLTTTLTLKEACKNKINKETS